MTTQTYCGHCLCQEVCYSVTGELRRLTYCHCESCRRATGSAFVAWGTVGYSNYTITHGELAIAQTSEHVERGFCRSCGSSLTYRHAFRSEEIDITLVTLEHPEIIQPEAHIWVQDKLEWVRISDSLPQYQTVPGQ